MSSLTVDFAAAAAAARPAERLRPFAALEPDQPNACGRLLPSNPTSRTPAARWILPSSVGWLPAAAADRRQPQKKKAVGKFVPAATHPPPCLRRRYPTLETFAVDGFQPLPPTGDSRKKKAVGKFVPAFAHPPPCLRGSASTSETFAVDGSQPLPPIGDSRKKKTVGKFVPAATHPPPCLRRRYPTPGTLTP